MQNRETLNIKEVAAMLEAEPETVMQLARRGELPGTRIGKSWVFLLEDVLAFLRKRIAADTQARQQSICNPIAMAVSTPAKSRRRKLPDLPQLHVASGRNSKR
jgi:excisionase family DNA binding protein